jgi:hypothetical protein
LGSACDGTKSDQCEGKRRDWVARRYIGCVILETEGFKRLVERKKVELTG